MSTVKEELADFIGSENILDGADTLKAYSTDLSFVHPQQPHLVAKIKTSDEVQKIVTWANRTKTPLVPVSSGVPHSRGDTIPGVPGAVIIDLSGMKKIKRIDRKNRMTVIEPGVTFHELQTALRSEGLRPSMPLLPRLSKSVIASLLEREPITVPKYQWSLLEPLRCVEVTWGNGDRMMTGEAGERGTLEEQWALKLAQMIPMGPGQVDYYRIISAAQGSMGIVTWASVKCEILPKLHKLFFITSKRLEDLIECSYKLLKARLGDEVYLLNSSYLACILGKKPVEIERLRQELPRWAIVVGIAGREFLPAERVRYQQKDISDIAAQYSLKPVSSDSIIDGINVSESLLKPSPEPYWKPAFKGAFQDIFFLSTLNRTPEFINTVCSIAEERGYLVPEIGVYIQPVHQGAGCHCELYLPYNSDIPKDTEKAREIFQAASERLIHQGAFFSRPYDIWSDMVYKRDPQTAGFLKKVKGIFDPNNIMNPGKLCF